MKKQAITSVKVLMVMFCSSLLSIAGWAQQQGLPGEYYKGTIYLKVQEGSGIQWGDMDSPEDLSGYAHFADIFRTFGVHKLYKPFDKIKSPFFEHTYQLYFSETGREQEFIQLLMREPTVEFAEQVPVMRSFYTPNDAFANNSNQWFLSQINAYSAWDLHQEGEGVVVAITDDAVKWDHQDLQGNLWINEVEYNGAEGVDDDGNGYIDDIIGWDAANWDNDPGPPFSDGFSHGTHCAGIAGSVTDNWMGGASISFNNARIMSCKGKTDGNTGTEIDNVWGAFQYAVAAGADIISCSWGGLGGFSFAHQNLVNYAADNGSIIVAAAGNDNTSGLTYPAAYDNVVAVANTAQGDIRNSNSNYGTWIDIAAPGTSILSPIAYSVESYDNYSGTSMSCPMVAGLIAHMKSFKPEASNDEIMSCLLSSSDNIDAWNPGFQGLLGSGRINARAALECLDGGGGGGDCNGIALNLTITLDDYGDETTWGVFQSGNLILSGGPYAEDAEGTVVGEELCLTEGCYDLVFFDEFGDGMCCDFGEGSYVLSAASGEELASGGSFEEQEVNTFCVGGGGSNGCPAPDDLHTIQVGYSHVYLDWSATDGGADAYRTQFREAGEPIWNNGNWFTSSNTIWGNMSPCTDYEFQVQSRCDGVEGPFSNPISVSTRGCNEDYCYSYGTTWDDWIARVQLKDIDHETGKSYGFGDYMHINTELDQGTSYPLTLTPATDNNQKSVFWRVWIDFNQDKDFLDPGELVLQQSADNTATISENITVPGNASEGPTRMRVSMNGNGFAQPCSVNSIREVEDYTVFINENDSPTSILGTDAGLKVSVFPNPVRHILNVQIEGGQAGKAQAAFHNVHGQLVRQWEEVELLGNHPASFMVGGLPSGVYWLEVAHAGHRTVHKVVIQ